MTIGIICSGVEKWDFLYVFGEDSETISTSVEQINYCNLQKYTLTNYPPFFTLLLPYF